jgi:outer membrane biosynthesis protein TonB
VKFVAPFPAFNNAITDAMQQWEFEPLLVQGKPAAFCMTVTVNINWQ